jgi:hypothetical protein
MIVARKYLKLLAVFSAMLALAVSCSKSSSPLEEPVQGGDIVEPSGFPVSLAFGMKDVKYSPATKTLAQVAQADGSANSFRGMSGIWFLPFDVQREIRADDTRSGDYLRLPYEGISDDFGDDGSSGSFQGLVNSNNSHYYKSIYIPSGTASFLVYGKAKEVSPVTIGSTTYTSGTQAYKHLYGSLIASDEASGGTAGVKASDITFSPDPIADATARAAIVSKAQRLANYMTSLFTTTYSVNYYYRTSWYGSTQTGTVSRSWHQAISETWCSQTMENWYNTLLNGGGSGTQGNIYSCSGVSITNLLRRLYIALSAEDNTVSNSSYTPQSGTYDGCFLNSNRTTELTYRNFSASYRDEILEQIRTFATVSGSGNNLTLTLRDSDLRDFPVGDGLPEGCVAIKWDGSKFVAVTEGDYDIHLAPMDRFCYPPSLWYYVNSQISCAKKLNSEDDDAVAERAIAAYYKNTSATWTSILDQYNTGQRKFGPVVRKGAVSVAVNKPMQYGVALLKLNLNTTASTLKDADNADVTVSNTLFPMTAVIVAGQHKQSFDFTPQTGNEYYVYDNMPLSDAGETLAWITSLANTNNPSYTLLLQSLQAEDVIICIEFQNNSSTTFKGETGYIVPGSKFYMLGTLTYGSGQGNQTLVKSVFQQDYVTEVNLTINSLKKAFNCIPDLQDPQLEVGVEIDIDWILATPSEIPLY